MSFFKLQEPRQFEYIPRFYRPEEDEEKPRIQFRRIRHSKRLPKTSPLRLLLMILILLFAMVYLSQQANRPVPQASQPFQVEEIVVVD